MASLGDLVVNLTANTSKFALGMRTASQSVQSFSRRATTAIGRFTSQLFTMRNAIIGAGATSLVSGFARLAAEAETLAIQMRVLTGSTAVATKLLSEISEFAAETPFQKMDIGNAAKQLIAFNGSADTVVSELRRLGDVAAATGTPLIELASLYGKARVNGRLFAEDVNQFMERGIPIQEELAKQFGVTALEVRGLVSEGKIGFKELEKAFISLTAEGSKFAGMTAELSQSTAGKFSTMKDNFSELAKELGTELLPAINEVLEALTKLAKMTDGGKPVTSYLRNIGTDMVLTGKSLQYSMEGTLWGEDSENRRKQLYRDIINLQRAKRGDFAGIRETLGAGLPMQATPTTRFTNEDMRLKSVQRVVQQSGQSIAMAMAQGISGATSRGAFQMPDPMQHLASVPLLGMGLAGAMGSGQKTFDHSGTAGDQGLPGFGLGAFALTAVSQQLAGNLLNRESPMRLAGANERGSASALSTVLNARNQGTRWEEKTYTVLQDTHKLLADGITVNIPDESAIAIVENLA